MAEPKCKSDVPELRIRAANGAAVRADGDFILYWMVANRRTHWNYSLERAVDWAKSLVKPLVVLEALRCDYEWASDRLHQFVVEGMADNARGLRDTPVTYYPYVEPRKGADKGLLAALARVACVVVSDDYPCFFLPRMAAAAAKQIPVRFELIDSNGLLPMRAAKKVFLRAVDFRRFLQKNLRDHLLESPRANPLARVKLPRLKTLPKEIVQKWPATDVAALAAKPALLAKFPIDHAVKVACQTGGEVAAGKRLKLFLQKQLADYAEQRSHPDADATSGLSPYLHFGHLSAHEVFHEVAKREKWSPKKLSTKADGRGRGWWGVSESGEGFLDQLATWREVGFNLCWQREDYDQYESLPAWAQETLAEHEGDEREFVYSLGEFEAAETHDPLWNATQRQLVREGRLHNYLRMLWGKKILHWSATPREALATMIELNNKYGLDGRDPNSYSGIFWVLGRYDRAWGPERPIFGKIRYMCSKNTARKLHVKEYLKRHSEDAVDG